ncbi:hypothetical protein [uncultured Methanospirillum sp.]|uniref:hypothetical protein n=1 Tax=uncultured Methanospirillum sp. TaxID=262503 RepID=UPI0029C71EA8|nr:hypothetical protein [uncultured Methanospirillum sp.]
MEIIEILSTRIIHSSCTSNKIQQGEGQPVQLISTLTTVFEDVFSERWKEK